MITTATNIMIVAKTKLTRTAEITSALVLDAATHTVTQYSSAICSADLITTTRAVRVELFTA